jgi:hypothetical protein
LTSAIAAPALEAEELRASLGVQLVEAAPTLEREFPQADYVATFDATAAIHGYRHVPAAARASSEAIARRWGTRLLETYHMSVLATLMAQPQARIERAGLTGSIVALMADAFRRIVQQIRRPEEGFWLHDNDLFAKDFALCRLKLLPCGAEHVDVSSGVPRRIVAAGGVRQCAAALRFFLGAGGFNNWYESHWDRRLVRSFNSRAYDQCYLRLAELLERHPQMRGVMSSSWWFDPVLGSISPNLAFLRTVPQSAGARLFRVGVDANATHDALTRAPDRARLHAAGKYQPQVYMLAWARTDLIAWASRQPR